MEGLYGLEDWFGGLAEEWNWLEMGLIIVFGVLRLVAEVNWGVYEFFREVG